MASFKAKFPVLQELFAKNHRGGALWAPPPSGARVNIVTLSIQIRTRGGCGKRPMLAPKTNSEPRNLNFSLQKSEQTARFDFNRVTSF